MKFKIKAQFTPHGSFSWEHSGSDAQWCEAGDAVRLLWTNDAKWGLQEAHYTDGEGNVTPIDITSPIVEFIMPSKDVTIGGTFKRFVVQSWTEGKGKQEDEAVFVKGENGEPKSMPINQFIGTITDAELDNDSERPVQNKVVTAALGEKQDNLVSGQNIKTLNGESLLGNGNIVIEQHFKGWWPDLDTLKDAITAVDGDYAYVADPSPATTTSIYVYDEDAATDNYWSDSGRDVDTSDINTFESGEALNEVSIIDDVTTGGEHDVLSAEQGKKLTIAELPVVWVDNQYINKDSGNFVNQNGYSRTQLIDIHGLSPLYLTGTITGSVVAGVSMWDSNCRYLGALVTVGTYSDELLTLPDNVHYIALSTAAGDVAGMKLYTNNAPNALASGIVAQRLTTVLLKRYTHCYVKKTTGEIVKYTSSSFYISQDIKVNPRKNYFVTTKGIGNASAASMIAYFSADGALVGELYGPTSTAEADQYNMLRLELPATAAYMIVTKTSLNATSQVVTILTDDELVNERSFNDEPDSFDLQEKVTAGGTVRLANRMYTVTTAIEVPSYCEIIGQGTTTMYLDTPDTSLKIFHLDNKENVRISGIRFDGQDTIKAGSPSSTVNPPVMTVAELRSRSLEGTRTAILVENGDRCNVIENCEFVGFDKAGVVFYRSHDMHQKHCKIINCQFHNNWYGLLLDVRAEFTNVANCSFNANKVGVYVAGGNNIFANNHFDENEVGFCVCSTLGENADHGSSSNSTYNHNTVYGICCIDASSGFIFTAASCYGGTMLIDNCNAIQVVNSMICVNIINQYTNDTDVVPTRTGINFITNNLFKTVYMDDSAHPIPNKTKMVLNNNYWYTGANSSALNN